MHNITRTGFPVSQNQEPSTSLVQSGVALGASGKGSNFPSSENTKQPGDYNSMAYLNDVKPFGVSSAIAFSSAPLDLTTNGPVYPVSQNVLRAYVSAVLQNRSSGYPSVEGLRKAVAGLYGVAADQVYLGTGSNDLLKIIPAMFALGGVKNFICAKNDYLFGEREAGFAGMAVQALPTLPDYKVDLDGLLTAAKAADEKGEKSLVYFSNPNNPSGTTVPRERLEAFLKALPPSATVVVDQAYGDFIPEEERINVATFLAENPNIKVIFLGTSSKGSGTPGARAGWAVASQEIASQLNKFSPQQLAVGAIDAVGVAVAIGETARRGVVIESIRRGAAQISEVFKKHNVTVVSGPDVNFVTARLSPRQADELTAYLKHRGYLIANIGRGFYSDFGGCIRMTVPSAEHRPDFMRALDEGLAQVLRLKSGQQEPVITAKL